MSCSQTQYKVPQRASKPWLLTLTDTDLAAADFQLVVYAMRAELRASRWRQRKNNLFV